jgi:hypothetical protein
MVFRAGLSPLFFLELPVALSPTAKTVFGLDGRKIASSKNTATVATTDPVFAAYVVAP